MVDVGKWRPALGNYMPHGVSEEVQTFHGTAIENREPCQTMGPLLLFSWGFERSLDGSVPWESMIVCIAHTT